MSKTDKIKNDIWNLLLSRGYKHSSHSNKILLNLYPDGTRIKYKFGKNNIQKFRNEFKIASIPFSRLEITDGKIFRIVEKEEE